MKIVYLGFCVRIGSVSFLFLFHFQLLSFLYKAMSQNDYFAYIRVSTPKQGQRGTSLVEQRAAQ